MSDTAALEAASYATWTADMTDVVAGWDVAATAGVSRRVNSARAIGEATVDADSLIALRGWFDDRGLAFVVRETPLMAPATSAAVRDVWGFESLDETIVMIRDSEASAPDTARVVDVMDESFQAALARLNGRTGPDAVTLARIHARVAHRSAGIWIPGAAVGVVARNDGLAAVFSVAVAPEQRRRGLAREMMTVASRWAEEHSVPHVFIQVAGTNHAAIELYRTLGFTEVYRYRYLQPVGATSPS